MSKSNPVRLWRFGRTGALIFTQKWPNRAKTGVPKNTKKNYEVQHEVFWWSKRYNWLKTIEKSNLSFTVWPHESSTFKKKRTRNGHFPRPRETDPYIYVSLLGSEQACTSIFNLKSFVMDSVQVGKAVLQNSAFQPSRGRLLYIHPVVVVVVTFCYH